MHRYRLLITTMLAALVVSPLQAHEGGIDSLRETGKAFAAVAREVSPSVVFIQVQTAVSERPFTGRPSPFGGEPFPFGDEFFRRFFEDQFPGFPHREEPRERRPFMGQGSGFVFAAESGLLSDKTYILTNNHVVRNAEKIKVKFQDGREFDAEVTGADPKSDVAVIEIKAGNIPALTLADSEKLEVGEWVVAIGNPFGLSHTLTVGVVSAKGRTSLGISDYEDFIQTDAAINPGNSGGPLVNLDGEVVGMNTAIFSRSGGYMGVGFAIPINLAMTIANQLIDQGEVTRGFLGIVIQPLTPELAESFDLEETQGILISQVTPDSPADKAGLRQGDVIVAYQGTPVRDIGGFRNRVSLTQPGSTQVLTISREGQRQEIEVTIGTLPEGGILAGDTTQSAEELGLTVQTLTPELAEQFDAKAGEGVVVTAVTPGSIAAQAGIRPGAIIVQVNQSSISSAAEFKRVVGESRDNRVLLLVQMDNHQRFIVLRW
jgi:serine protease Do